LIAGLLYALATLFDLVTTTIALHSGLHEGNPIVAPFINQYGILPQILVSAVICSALWWYAVRGGAKLVYLLAVVRWVVVGSNAMQLANSAHVLGLWR
jgi:hypothetical protein